MNDALDYQDKHLDAFFKKVSEEKSTYAYAEGKWTLKEMMQHITDCERIFCYRALAGSRKDPANLPGFDENVYANNADANRRTWASLTEELKAVRHSTKLMFTSFTEEMLNTTVTFNGNSAPVKVLGLIITGHLYHHIKIAEERYF